MLTCTCTSPDPALRHIKLHRRTTVNPPQAFRSNRSLSKSTTTTKPHQFLSQRNIFQIRNLTPPLSIITRTSTITMSSGLMDTVPGGEGDNYEDAIKTVTEPHKKSGGQMGRTCLIPLSSSLIPFLFPKKTPPQNTKTNLTTRPRNLSRLQPRSAERSQRRSRRQVSGEDPLWPDDERAGYGWYDG